MFGIATSAESFESRLSGRALRYVEGQTFAVTPTDEILERLFRTMVADTNVALRVGPTLCKRMMERQRNHVQNVKEFTNGIKVHCGRASRADAD